MDVPTPIVSGTPRDCRPVEARPPTPPVLFAYIPWNACFSLFWSSCHEWAKAEKFTFKPPSLSEEEQHSNFCQKTWFAMAVGPLVTSFFRIRQKRMSKRRIDETAVYDVIEESCRQEKYADYGIKGHEHNFLVLALPYENPA